MSRKSAAALAILSLDSLSPFIDELWVPSNVEAWRRAGLRKLLAGYMVQPYQLMVDSGEVCAWVYQELRSQGELALWKSAHHWGQVVYGNHGTRQAESDWLSILAGVQHREQAGLPEALRQRLIKINAEWVDSIGRITHRLESLQAGELSNWDAAICDQLELPLEHFAWKIESMVEENQLVRSWRIHGGFAIHELRQIYRWGAAKRLADRVDKHYEVKFPGSWDYGLVSENGGLPGGW